MGVVSWFLKGVRNFNRTNLRELISLSIQKSIWLLEQNRCLEALAMMESVALIEASDYASPSLVIGKLRRRLQDIDPVMALSFFLRLNHLLFVMGQQELAIKLLELEIGLCSDDYNDPQQISARLLERCRGFREDQVFAVGLKLATTLGHGERTSDALVVVEVLLHLHRDDYSNMNRLTQILRTPPNGIDQDGWLGAISFLFWLLDQSGRKVEAITIFEATFEIEKSDYSSAVRLRNKVRLPIGDKFSGLVIAGTLVSLGLFSGALTLLEYFLEIQSDHYRDPGLWIETQMNVRSRTPGELYDIGLIMLMSTLVIGDRIQDAMACLMNDTGLAPGDLAIAERVANCLQERCRGMPPNAAGRYIFAVSLVLSRADLAGAAISALEADTQLKTLDWEDLVALSAALDERLRELSPTTRSMFLFQVFSSLSETGHARKAALLVDAYVRALSPLAGREEDPFLAPILCVFFEIWLDYWAQDPSRNPVELCRRLVPYLHVALAQQGVWLRDRESFIREVGKLRRRIVQTGLYWAIEETDPARRAELQRTVLVWDLELAQRLLVERFLLSELPAVPLGALPICGAWPLHNDEQPHTSSHLPVGFPLGALGVLGKVPFLPGPTRSR